MLIAIENEHEASTTMLLENNANPDQPDKNEVTPLHLAASSGNYAITNTLIQYTSNIDPIGEHMATPLIEAIENSHINTVELLLKNRANPNKRSHELGCTPLQQSIFAERRPDIGILLRQYGARPATEFEAYIALQWLPNLSDEERQQYRACILPHSCKDFL